jgi:hypothetical protein
MASERCGEQRSGIGRHMYPVAVSRNGSALYSGKMSDGIL